MNNLTQNTDDVVECPLCMEPLEVDDLHFYPCTCGYQICRFCWHRIRTDENELCPACRKEYPENPADFTPLTQEEMIAFKSQKRQRDQQRKQKITENRKHLANVRVVQKNLVFVVGLPPRLADADILKKHEYFGKFGKIHKVVINPSTTYAGVQGPSASAYVTYVNNSDALRAIQSVNNVMIDGRLIKTSLGTTKYCSHFMKNQQCPKSDCMYLHELGDPEASFTKDEMHQGKHQEYEKRLHDALIAACGTYSTVGIVNSAIANGSSVASTPTNSSCTPSFSQTSKNSDVSKSPTSSSSVSSTSSSVVSKILTSLSSSALNVSTGTSGASTQQKDSWPSLSISPVNNKDVMAISGNTKNKKEKMKHEKLKIDKNTKLKKNNTSTSNTSNFNQINKDQQRTNNGAKETIFQAVGLTDLKITSESTQFLSPEENNSYLNNCPHINKTKSENNKETFLNDLLISNQKVRELETKKSVDNEIKSAENSESNKKCDNIKKFKNNHNIIDADTTITNSVRFDEDISNTVEQRSVSSSSTGSSNSRTNSDCLSTLSESTSGKSSPRGSVAEFSSRNLVQRSEDKSVSVLDNQSENKINIANSTLFDSLNKSSQSEVNKSVVVKNIHDYYESNVKNDNFIDKSNCDDRFSGHCVDGNDVDATDALSKLQLFEDNNSFFSSSPATSFQQSLLLKSRFESETRQNHSINIITPHLPDLLNGIDGFQNNPANSIEWEEAFKNVMQRNKDMEAELYDQSLQHKHQIKHQEDLQHLHELQKRNHLPLVNRMPQSNRQENDFSNILCGSSDINRLSQASLMQHQQQLLQQQTTHSTDHVMSNGLFGTNMSKFFDFHKTQQQQINQQFFTHRHENTPNDHVRMDSSLENSHLNSQYLDPMNGHTVSQQQLQPQRLGKCGKFEPLQLSQHGQGPQQQQNAQHRMTNTQFLSNASVDDELGFDPFAETQKALAELMENEVAQQQNVNADIGGTNANVQIDTKIMHQQQLLENIQRACMPPPGFNHMNAFGFGVPRAQNNSKIIPFINLNSCVSSNNGRQVPQQQQSMTTWSPHLATLQQQQLNDSQMYQLNQSNSVHHNKGYSNNDWTTMDPAILSFRQFSSLPKQPTQQDSFIHHLTHQQQPNIQGFNIQPQLQGNINLPNPMMNSQSSQAQVNANVQGMLEYLKTRQFV